MFISHKREGGGHYKKKKKHSPAHTLSPKIHTQKTLDPSYLNLAANHTQTTSPPQTNTAFHTNNSSLFPIISNKCLFPLLVLPITVTTTNKRKILSQKKKNTLPRTNDHEQLPSQPQPPLYPPQQQQHNNFPSPIFLYPQQLSKEFIKHKSNNTTDNQQQQENNPPSGIHPFWPEPHYDQRLLPSRIHPSPATNQHTHLQPFPFLFVEIATLITPDEEERISREKQI